MPQEGITPAALFEQALELARSRSLERERVDWSRLTKDFRARAASCRTFAESHRLIRELIAHLGDRHSFLRTPDDMVQGVVAEHTGLRLHQEEPVVIDVLPGSPASREGLRIGDRVACVGGERVTPDNWRSLRRDALQAGTRLELADGDGRCVTLAAGFVRPHHVPEARMFAAGVGFLDLPGHDGDGSLGDGLNYGEAVSEQLHELERAGVRAWIVDLRRCDGGNMWPILAGLTPLLGTGMYGSFVDPVSNTWHDWGFDGRALRVVNRKDPGESYLMAEVPGWEALREEGAPVAVLMSAVTSSSGEAVLISFRGRENTRSFGLATGGLTTSNNLHLLVDGSWLLLAESLEADRLGRVYQGRVSPDESVEIHWQLLGTEEDPVIQAAMRWLGSRDLTP
jgi:carboxyl-terminal processing protease